jgi:hypothetical protein
VAALVGVVLLSGFFLPSRHSFPNFSPTSLSLSSTASLQVAFLHLHFFPPSTKLQTTTAVRVITLTMPGRRTLQNWDAETHEAVLIALIEHMKPAGGDWTAIVASLHLKGYTFTEGALV